MRVKAQGFILFSFAFSSVLSTAEILQVPIQSSNEKTALEATASGPIATQNKRNKTPERDLEKRSAQDYDREKEEKKGIDGSEIYYDQNDSKKRARLGFTGMRGKKEYNPDDFCADRLRLEGLNLNKRISKSINDLIEGKRGNVAFYGMRGKKAEDYDGEPVDLYSNEEFLVNSGLMDGPEEGSVDEMMSKRSPYSFQGIRGKKKTAYDLKRTMGFLGMRGKKASEVWEPEFNYKRTSQTGFFGMKGKKAQLSGFFGMRGKKSSPDAFFGIKEDSEPSPLENFSYLNEDSRGRFRRGVTWVNNLKKGNKNFNGGKKSNEERSRSSSSD